MPVPRLTGRPPVRAPFCALPGANNNGSRSSSSSSSSTQFPPFLPLKETSQLHGSATACAQHMIGLGCHDKTCHVFIVCGEDCQEET